MKRFGSAMLVGVVAVLVASAPAQAQYIFAGLGASKPMGSFNDVAKTGWMFTGGIGADIGDKGLWIEGEGYYGSNDRKVEGDKTNTFAFIGALGYSFKPEAKISPYVTGGVGIVASQYKTEAGGSLGGGTEKGFGYTGAVGVGFKAGSKLTFWLEGRLLGSTGDHGPPGAFDAKSQVITLGGGLSIALTPN
jgi:opacity protein-like surface antigen